MQFLDEFDINTFDFYNGAKTRIKIASDSQLKEVERRIEMNFKYTFPTRDAINNFVWFECDDIFFPEEDEEDEEEDE